MFMAFAPPGFAVFAVQSCSIVVVVLAPSRQPVGSSSSLELRFAFARS